MVCNEPRFLPAIELINLNTRIVNVDSGVDYRLRTLEQAEIFHFPLDEIKPFKIYINILHSWHPELGTDNQEIRSRRAD